MAFRPASEGVTRKSPQRLPSAKTPVTADEITPVFAGMDADRRTEQQQRMDELNAKIVEGKKKKITAQ
jgi:hypothetical protein